MITNDPDYQCLAGWQTRQRIGVFGVHYDESMRSVGSCAVLPYASVREKVHLPSQVGCLIICVFHFMLTHHCRSGTRGSQEAGR